MLDGDITLIADLAQHGAEGRMIDFGAGSQDAQSRFVGVEMNQHRPDGLERFDIDFTVVDQRFGVELYAKRRAGHFVDDVEAFERGIDEIGILRPKGFESKARSVAFDTGHKFAEKRYSLSSSLIGR